MQVSFGFGGARKCVSVFFLRWEISITGLAYFQKAEENRYNGEKKSNSGKSLYVPSLITFTLSWGSFSVVRSIVQCGKDTTVLIPARRDRYSFVRRCVNFGAKAFNKFITGHEFTVLIFLFHLK